MERRCAHESCGCEAAQGRYCSAYCENVERHEEGEGACACEHAACREAQRVGAEGGEERETHTAVGHTPSLGGGRTGGTS